MLRLVSILILLLPITFVHAQVLQTPVSETAYDARFRPLIPRLRGKVDVLIRLPHSLQPFQTSRRSQVYLSVDNAESSAYVIRIESDKSCNGANACFVGSISGQLRTAENEENLDTIIAEGKVVRLANGMKGYYFEGPCGASCVPDSLMWQQEGFYYIVTAAGLGVSKMMQVANSMIVSSPINL